MAANFGPPQPGDLSPGLVLPPMAPAKQSPAHRRVERRSRRRASVSPAHGRAQQSPSPSSSPTRRASVSPTRTSPSRRREPGPGPGPEQEREDQRRSSTLLRVQVMEGELQRYTADLARERSQLRDDMDAIRSRTRTVITRGRGTLPIGFLNKKMHRYCIDKGLRRIVRFAEHVERIARARALSRWRRAVAHLRWQESRRGRGAQLCTRILLHRDGARKRRALRVLRRAVEVEHRRERRRRRRAARTVQAWWCLVRLVPRAQAELARRRAYRARRLAAVPRAAAFERLASAGTAVCVPLRRQWRVTLRRTDAVLELQGWYRRRRARVLCDNLVFAVRLYFLKCRLIVRIQCLVRRVLAVAALRRKRERRRLDIAATKIQRLARTRQQRARFVAHHDERLRQRAAIEVIQRAWFRCQGMMVAACRAFAAEAAARREAREMLEQFEARSRMRDAARESGTRIRAAYLRFRDERAYRRRLALRERRWTAAACIQLHWRRRQGPGMGVRHIRRAGMERRWAAGRRRVSLAPVYHARNVVLARRLLQRVARGQLGRRRVRRLRALLVLQKFFRDVKSRIIHQQFHGNTFDMLRRLKRSAVSIQSLARGHLQRLRYRELLAAITIQRMERGRKGRRLARRRRLVCLVNASSRVLQGAWRRYAGRVVLRWRCELRRQRDDERRLRAALVLQRVVRGDAGRRRFAILWEARMKAELAARYLSEAQHRQDRLQMEAEDRRAWEVRELARRAAEAARLRTAADRALMAAEDRAALVLRDWWVRLDDRGHVFFFNETTQEHWPQQPPGMDLDGKQWQLQHDESTGFYFLDILTHARRASLPPRFRWRCPLCLKPELSLWCFNCMEPSCRDCYDSGHARGKRAQHAYCEVPEAEVFDFPEEAVWTWTETWDLESRTLYYVNDYSGATSWDEPKHGIIVRATQNPWAERRKSLAKVVPRAAPPSGAPPVAVESPYF